MGRPKINTVELTGKLNRFRMENGEKTFTSEELIESLQKLGFNKNASHLVITRYFPYELIGKARLYAAPKDPIHKSQVEAIYETHRLENTRYKNKVKSSSEQQLPKEEEEAWQILIDKGLVKRVFDINALKAKYPKIYLECLRYEIVK